MIDVCETLILFFDNSYFLDVFDESVSRVGQNLFNFGVKTLGQICSTSGLSVKVRNSIICNKYIIRGNILFC